MNDKLLVEIIKNEFHINKQALYLNVQSIRWNLAKLARKIMQQSISYIIRFLCGEDLPDSVFERIGYTNDADEYEKYEVVIVRSDFFDDDK